MDQSMLVLSQFVYAKKQDGEFYSGRIEGKTGENTYNIAFTDYTNSTVDENDLIWLGFYSLPPHSWPKSPVVHPVNIPKDASGLRHSDQIKREIEFSSRGPDSLRFLKSSKDFIRDEERMSGDKKRCFIEQCRCEDANVKNLDSLPFREHKFHQAQRRSSVLRLNRKVLSAEISQTANENETYFPALDTTRTKDKWARFDENEEFHFSKLSQGSTSPHHSSYSRQDPPYLNTPCLTPPTTPGSLPPPLFVCNPYETAAFNEMDTREWIQMDRRDIGGGKRRRRDNMKKCRKVYGIDNRDLWCTQCKWKKACTRFQIGNYAQRHF